MRKNTERPTNKGPRGQKPAQHSTPQNKLVFGNYQNIDGKEYVVDGSTKYALADVKKGIKEPIDQNAKVKAFIKPKKRGHDWGVMILKVFGPELSLNSKILGILKDADIPIEFDSAVENEAKSFGKSVDTKEAKRRLDLSGLAMCTIDGETAKDFDDAVFARKKGKNIEVVVAIADVSHYVKNGSKLDQEAIKRATSIYYPGACVPMLPEQLSNGLCSLRPNVLRLALAVTFELGPKGGIFSPKIKEAVIKSKARLTYSQVQDFYDGKLDPKVKISAPIKNSLNMLHEAADILRKSRMRRGAIDFDIVESVVALDDLGEPTSIHPAARLGTHKIIEDLMVATNEIVADYFERKDIPCLYRVHEAPNPEKLESFFNTAHAFGALKGARKTRASSITEPKALQEVMSHYKSSKYRETLNSLMLRAMMQAKYSEKNLMHFGLASTAYLHFTSPIRRYADLVVHRQLRYVLFERNHRKKLPERVMAQIAESIFAKESTAVDIERKVDRLYAATFLSTRIGEVFDATIVSCTDFGLFVRITEHHVEGLVHISAIANARVNFVPEQLALVVSGSNKKYMVGDEIKVKLVSVNVERGHIDFAMEKDAARSTDEQPSPKIKRKPSRRRR